MGTPPHLARQDRPISSIEGDELTRGPFVANLARALVSEDRSDDGSKIVRSTGFTVGLTGEWGAGKSSVLYLLGQYLASRDRVVVTTLNPWLFKGRDELVQAYFNSLRAALGRSPREQVTALQQQLDRYRKSIDSIGSVGAAALDAAGAGGAASAAWGILGKAPKAKITSPDEERASLERKLVSANVAVVVLIDELDRVEDEEVRAVAQLVKAVGDIKGVSYLVAYDHRRVAMALGRGESPSERAASGSAYLEKIVQFAIPLRPLFSDDVRALLVASLRQNSVDLPDADQDHQQAIFEALVAAIRTPREVKRLAGAFAVLEEIVRGEICAYDVLGYSWVATKLPEVRQLIAEHIEAIVDDPNEAGLINRYSLSKEERNKAKLFANVFGDIKREYRELLCILFPWFAEEETRVGGDRLAKRRNLVRLLYLGDPPGMVPRRDVEALWVSPDAAAVRASLNAYLENDRLRLLLERVADFLPVLPKRGDSAFWVALSKTLIRSHDWVNGPETLGDAVDDAAQTLWNLATRGPEEAGRVRQIMADLVIAGDLLIVPWLLRRHLFALNLVRESNDREEQAFLTKDETQELLKSETQRYREAILSETALRRLPDTEVFYTLANAEAWDDELRESLTNQLGTIEAIGTFAALTVRPGLIASYKSMNQMLDPTEVSKRLCNIVAADGLPANQWLAASIMRLQAVLRGHDATFIGHSLGEKDEAAFAALFGPDENG